MSNLFDSVYDAASPEERLYQVMNSEVLQQGITHAHWMKDSNANVSQLLMNNVVHLIDSLIEDKIKFFGDNIREGIDDTFSQLNYYYTLAIAESVAMRMRIKELQSTDDIDLLNSFGAIYTNNKPSEVCGMISHLCTILRENYYPNYKEPISNNMIPCAIDIDEGRIVLPSSDQALFNELVGGLFYDFYDGNPRGEEIPLDSGIRNTH